MYEQVPREGHFDFYPRTAQNQQKRGTTSRGRDVAKLEPMLELRPNERESVAFIYCDFISSLV